MGRFVKGDVVVVPFPFSNLSESKRRPALVVAPLIGDDVILCQITSRDHNDSYSIALDRRDFERGSLPKDSNIRPNRLFTAEASIIVRWTGKVVQKKLAEVVNGIEKIIEG
ncbi:MAG: type II toxin-antitoxin system PemK/MazF family toxin [Candidatus Krumholzibacteria bacterium]|nr:type II toxin-antitoxin system PemK/MazF family toxin [Candidatus Krumholzibacteria bacterium]